MILARTWHFLVNLCSWKSLSSRCKPRVIGLPGQLIQIHAVSHIIRTRSDLCDFRPSSINESLNCRSEELQLLGCWLFLEAGGLLGIVVLSRTGRWLIILITFEAVKFAFRSFLCIKTQVRCCSVIVRLKRFQGASTGFSFTQLAKLQSRESSCCLRSLDCRLEATSASTAFFYADGANGGFCVVVVARTWGLSLLVLNVLD